MTGPGVTQMSEDSNLSEKSQYLTFYLGTAIYGVEITRVREIIEYHGATNIPMAARYMRGVINLRGVVVPVVDLLLLFGKSEVQIGKRTCIIILEILVNAEPVPVGLLVDSVQEVVDLSAEDLEPAPAFGTGVHTTYIQAMGKIGDQFAILINADLFLALNSIFEVTEESMAKGELPEYGALESNESIPGRSPARLMQS